MTDAAPALFCFGLGYSALETARRLLASGWRVGGTTRRPEKRDRLAAMGVAALLDDDADAVRRAAADARALLISAGPDEAGDPTLRAHAAALAAAEAGGRLRWIGYLSTTGVYGDHGGAWIDETAPREPATARGRARVVAEDAWMDRGGPIHLFRLAGIYGPGRGPFEKVRNGTARRIIKPGQVFSRVHVEDIATTLIASIAAPRPGRAYNVCDDAPAPPQDVIAHAAELLGLPAPAAVPFEEATREMSPMAVSFYAESKRVSNARIKRELGVVLRYPSYREGLAALLASGA